MFVFTVLPCLQLLNLSASLVELLTQGIVFSRMVLEQKPDRINSFTPRIQCI